MPPQSVYLDYNATAPVRPGAMKAVLAALGTTGNPSSVHGFGRAARRLVEEAREAVAALVGAAPAGVVFTSGGTEANALALAGLGRERILVSAVEHPSILKGGAAGIVPVDRHGVVDLAALQLLLAQDDQPALVAVMLANNETGAIQPIAEVVRLARAHGALVHCDAIQAAGRIPIDITELGVDTLSLSGHKLGGPQGVGALVLSDPDTDIHPILGGGGQERRRRAGTENVPGIAGLGAAAAEAQAELPLAAAQAAWRDRLEKRARAAVPDLVVFSAEAARLPNTSCLAIPQMSAQTALMGLDLAGVAVSSGSACSSGKVAASHVLTAMGAGALAASALRISLGWASREADVDRFVEALAGFARAAAPVA